MIYKTMFLFCFALFVCHTAQCAKPVKQNDSQVANAILKLGGVVKRDKTLPGSPIIEVNFQASSTGKVITDKDLALIQNLKHIKTLYLGYVTVTTDKGLVYLRNLKSLVKLALPDTRITDAGLKNLQGLDNLEDLGMPFCKGITDKGLKYLRNLKKLKELNVGGTKVTDRGVAQLQKDLPNLYIIR
jgi:hypothetical protein